MAPDLNSLPPSRPLQVSPSSVARALSTSSEAARSPSPQSRSASTSLQAAAAVNAGLRQEGSRRSSSSSATRTNQAVQAGRRRSTVLMNLQLNDPNVPAPGEMIHDGHSHFIGSPQSLTSSPVITGSDSRHYRAPSLGEIHQELEQEQEAQVNRLLQMIRTQQQQLNVLQGSTGQQNPAPVIDESTPVSDASMPFSNTNPAPPRSTTSTPRSPTTALHPRSSFDLARAEPHRQSRTPSRNASPRMRSTSISADTGEAWTLGGRDESAFYQAETQMMVRENQMLRRRIAELERQVNELNTNSAITHEPATPSRLLRSTSVSEEAQLPMPGALPVDQDGKDE